MKYTKEMNLNLNESYEERLILCTIKPVQNGLCVRRKPAWSGKFATVRRLLLRIKYPVQDENLR